MIEDAGLFKILAEIPWIREKQTMQTPLMSISWDSLGIGKLISDAKECTRKAEGENRSVTPLGVAVEKSSYLNSVYARN